MVNFQDENKCQKQKLKNLNKKQRYGRKKEHGRFLNKYDFAYLGRDTVNQAMKGLGKLAPKVIGHASKETDKIIEARISHR